MADRPSPVVISNKDDTVPVLNLDDNHSPSSSSSQPPAPHRSSVGGARDKLKLLNSKAAAKLQERLEIRDSKNAERDSPRGMQERIINMLLQQMIPSGPDEQGTTPENKRSRKYVERPNFSLPAMSANFRRFNARCGVLFVFQNKLIHLFSWKQPAHTMSFLAIYTFVCLDPYTLSIIPLALLLYFVMVPSFLTRHPPPASMPPTALYPLTGPPLAPPVKIKPAPELSKDFFYNMRDLQNSMEDFSVLHDAIVANVAPYTNFSSEQVSSTLFIALFSTSMALFLTAHIIPWRFIALLAGWAAVLSGHPTVQDLLDTPENSKLKDEQAKTLESRFRAFADADISLNPSPEKREVEVFEMQFRPLHADSNDEWEPHMFSPSPYTPLAPERLSGDQPQGTRFFEDVEPPREWRWADRKWTLDLLAKEWVEERMITGVEVEIEGGRWVYDVMKEDEDDNFRAAADKLDGYRYGEWRRRRWIRTVERLRLEKAPKHSTEAADNV